jgi:hypothetical protein
MNECKNGEVCKWLAIGGDGLHQLGIPVDGLEVFGLNRATSQLTHISDTYQEIIDGNEVTPLEDALDFFPTGPPLVFYKTGATGEFDPE